MNISQNARCGATASQVQAQKQFYRRPPSCQIQPLDVVHQPSAQQDPSRRAALLGLASLVAGASASSAAPQPATAATPVAEVGTYLPPADGLPGYCLYCPDGKKTPAIRAGVIKAEPEFYKFALPESWTEAPLLNPLTGNFCMPRCEEPWYEFKFENPKQGSAQLIVTELQKLGAKPTAQLKDLGSPEQVVNRVGNFITGTFLDEEDVLSAEARQLKDGREYYVYEVYSPYSKTAGHNLAAFTTKGGLAYLFVLTANDKQWGAAQPTLRKMLETFSA